MPKIELGDDLTFTATTRDGRRKVTRKVNGFTPAGLPTVRFNGWDRFVVGWAANDIIHDTRKRA